MASVKDFDGVLSWRCIGPFRGGRVVAVAGDPVDANVFYFGACAGGVWKSTDGGTYWDNVSDGFFNTASVGAIAVAESDPNVIYAGTGEACIRVDVTHGDGVYRSTDGGRTWQHKGLDDTRHIARVRVHPANPDLVYVAALGHAFGPNGQRGIFRSSDGGGSWEHILFKSENAGAADLCMDPNNPRILYATMWQGRRSPWEMASGGPDSGLHKSTDGGDTWTELTGRPGLPEGVMGRIGVAASPAMPGRIWALIEAEHGGLFRSDDGGDTWEELNDSEDVRARPWYYTHVFADPQDAETVWVLAAGCWKSTDGGRSFTKVTTPHGDNHDLWIDPANTRRMIEGNDGGACVSYNGGETWSTLYNQPTAQLYSAVTDDQFPYRVYGTQQDNSAISVPSRSFKGAILWEDCYTVGLSESGKIAVKPGDSNIVYSAYPGGTLSRYDHATGQVRVIMVWPEYIQNSAPKEFPYRFNWEFPIVVSPHDPNTLYIGGNMVFRSRDEGTSWEQISPDLTRNDESKQELSGPITSEGPWAEMYCTVYAFAESPHDEGVFWAGTDDGLVHISRDGGGSWKDITPEGLPEWTMVSIIEPSPHDPATAYLAATRYKLDDNRPFLYKTADYGETWTKITDGIREGDFTRVVREDPSRRGLLYAGTETGVYVSLDDGASWESMQLDLPVAPVYDLVIKDGDLVAATHGRSFWVLDDVTPLQGLSDDVLEAPGHLARPRSVTRLLPQSGAIYEKGPGKHYMSAVLGAPVTFREDISGGGATQRTNLNAGTNPPEGVLVTFHLSRAPEEGVALSFVDRAGRTIRTFSGKGDEVDRLNPRAGMNRFVWDLRYPEGRDLQDSVGVASPFGATVTGPLAPAGSYSVRLTVGGETYTQPFEILKDPRVTVAQSDLDEQFELQIRIRDRYSETHDIVKRLRDLRGDIEEWERRAEGHSRAAELSGVASTVKDKLSAIQNEIVPFRSAGAQPRGIPVGLYAKLKELMGVVASADWAPTKQSYEVFDDLSARLDRQAHALRVVIAEDLAAFVGLLEEMEIPAVVP